MKHVRILLTCLSIAAIATYSSCSKGGNSETTQDKQLGLLKKTWKVQSVSLGGVDQTSSWTNYTLTISGNAGQGTTGTYSYVCANRPALSPWPASGAWSFGTDPTTQIIRDKGTADELGISYAVNSGATTLQLSFSYTGNGYTRVGNVSGAWVFNLIPQ